MFKLITKFSKHNTYQKKVQMQRPRLLFGRESKDWIWSNEVKNLTWLVNSSIMYEPPQIVCMAPFFCTRKAITETLLPSRDENNRVLMILAAILPNGQGSLFDH